MLVLIMVLSGAEYISYRRESALFSTDMKNDALLLGNALSGMAEQAWKDAGEQVTAQLIQDANLKESAVAIRWVDLDSSSGRFTPAADSEKLVAVRRGNATSMVVKKGGGETFRLTYVPVSSGPKSRYAIELSESLSMLKHYTRNSLLRLAFTAMVLFLASGGILWFFFQTMDSSAAGSFHRQIPQNRGG